MTDIEQRLFYLEQLASRIDYSLNQLRGQLTTLGNQQRQMAGNQSGGGAPPESGGWTLYTCTVPSALTGPATFTAAVSPVMGPGAGGSPTIGVAIPGPTVAAKKGYVLGDGAGNYYLIAQSCT